MSSRLVPTQRRGIHIPQSKDRDSDFINVADVIRFLGFLLRYKWGILLFSLVGLGLGYLYCERATRIYQSKTQLLVVQQRMETVTGLTVGTHGLEEDVATHVAVIKSPVFLKNVVDSKQLVDLPSFADKQTAIGRLAKGLAVARDTEYRSSPSSTLTIAFTGTNREECQKILAAINDAYINFLAETSRSGKQDAYARITKKADDVLNTLNEKQIAYEAFVRENLPEWGDLNQGIAFHRERLSDVRSKQLDLELEKNRLQQSLENFLNEVALIKSAGGSFESILEVTPEYKSLAERGEVNQFLVPLLIEERQLLKKYGPGHHQVQEVREKIKYTKEYFSMGELTGQDRNASAEEAVQKYIRTLQDDVKRVESSFAGLEKVAAEESDEVKQLTELELQVKQFANSIAQSEKYYDSLIAQIQSVQFTEGMQGVQITVLLPPTSARAVSPNIPVALIGSLMGGILCGCGVAFVRHMNDKTFRDVGEVQRRLGLPVVGHITTPKPRSLPREPRQGDHDPKCSPLICAYHQPDSVYAEAYRGLRTALLFSTQDDRRIIQVTSPNPGDGKSVLLANLAVSMAYSGKQVLIIDADMRRPNAHRLLGCENDVGLSSVLLGEAEVADSIRETCVAGLSILPSGQVPDSPADLLTSSRFEELLENLRLRFDYILVDSPPLLPVTDGRIISTRVDGVLMLVQISKNSRPQAEKAKQVLDDLEAFLFGVVVRSNKANEFSYYSLPRDSQSKSALLPRAAV